MYCTCFTPNYLRSRTRSVSRITVTTAMSARTQCAVKVKIIRVLLLLLFGETLRACETSILGETIVLYSNDFVVVIVVVPFVVFSLSVFYFLLESCRKHVGRYSVINHYKKVFKLKCNCVHLSD